MDAEKWYYASGTDHVGPFTREQVAALVRSGVLRADTPVRQAGIEGWVDAGTLSHPKGTAVPVVQVDGKSPAATSDVDGAEKQELTTGQAAGRTSEQGQTAKPIRSADEEIAELFARPAVQKTLVALGWPVVAISVGYLAVIGADLLVSGGRRSVVESTGRQIMFLSPEEYRRYAADYRACSWGDCSEASWMHGAAGRTYGLQVGYVDTLEVVNRSDEEVGGTTLVWVRLAGEGEGVIECHQIRTLLLGRDEC